MLLQVPAGSALGATGNPTASCANVLTCTVNGLQSGTKYVYYVRCACAALQWLGNLLALSMAASKCTLCPAW